MTTREIGGFVTATLVLLFATAPGAQALERVTATSELQGNGFSTATAECDGTERVVSGGYQVTPGSSDTPVISKAKGERAWTVTAKEAGFTAYALCSKRINVQEVAKTVDFGSTSQGSGTPASARCPRGKRAIAGGFKFSTLVGNSPVFRSRPTDSRTWSVLALSEDEASKLKALAYCVPDRGGVSTRKDSTQVGTIESGSVEPKCRSGETLLSGGWTVSPRPDWQNESGPDTFFYSAYPAAQRRFVASAINFSDVAGKITGLAICAD